MLSQQEPLDPAENKLLAALPRRERDRLLPHLDPVSLRFEEVLYEPDGLIRHVYFPTSGMISLVLALEDNLIAQVGRVGSEGMVGLPVFLGLPTSHTRAFVEIPGEALRMKAQVFRQELRRAGALSGLAVMLVAAIASLVIRFRRDPVQREQIKWVLAAVVVVVVFFVVSEIARVASGSGGLPDAVYLAVLGTIPVAMAIAILRYRLYEIDRIVNRAVVYGLVTAGLAALYFGIVLDRSSQAKHFAVADALRRADLHDTVRTERKRSRLVEHDRVQEASLFEAASITHEEAVLRTERGGDRNHQGDGEPQCVRAGDHEHAHHALHREVPRSSENGPDDGRQHCGGDGDDGEEVRCSIRQRLGARA